MKKLSSLRLASAFLVPLAGAGPAAAQTLPARGQVQMTVHSHSAGELPFPSQRLPFNFTAGSTFAYSSRLCSANAPFNDIGLNFTPNYPGVDTNASSAARVRHGVTGTITSWNGFQGTVSGKIQTLLCEQVNGVWTASQHVLVSNFEGQIILFAPNDLHLYGGFQFSPTESTGTFLQSGMTGSFYNPTVTTGNQSAG